MSARRFALVALAAIAPYVVVYAATAFSLWQANPEHWDASARGLAVWVAVSASMFFAPMTAIFPGDDA
jgi:hypothetical protein